MGDAPARAQAREIGGGEHGRMPHGHVQPQASPSVKSPFRFPFDVTCSSPACQPKGRRKPAPHLSPRPAQSHHITWPIDPIRGPSYVAIVAS